MAKFSEYSLSDTDTNDKHNKLVEQLNKEFSLITYPEKPAYVPVLKFGGNSVGITYSTQTGICTKIGDVIIFSGVLILTSKGSSTGAATISMPEVCGHQSCVSLRMEDFNAGATGLIQGLTFVSQQYFRIEKFVTGAFTILTDADFKDTSIIIFSGNYEI